MSESLVLKRWLVLNRKQKGLPGQITINKEIKLQQPFPLIAIAALSRQLLGQVSSFVFEKQVQDETTVIYLSQQLLEIGGRSYRVAYVPASKTDQEVFSCFCDIFRETADIVISDINSANVHRLKVKDSVDNKHFVISGGKDIYQVAIKQGSLELLKNVATPFFNSLNHYITSQTPSKAVYWAILAQTISKYLRQWEWQLASDKNWSLLAIFVAQAYRCQEWLNNECKDYRKLIYEHKMLSKSQLQNLAEGLRALRQSNKVHNGLLFNSVVESTMAEVKKINQSNTINHINRLKQDIINSKIQNSSEFMEIKNTLTQKFSQYELEDYLSDLIWLPKELSISQQTIESLKGKNYSLQEQICKLRETIRNQQSAMMQCGQKIRSYQSKLAQCQELQRSKRELTQYLQSQTLRNHRMSLELQSHILLQRKSLQCKLQLENTILQQKRQKQGLLQCLHELTQQNLSLLGQNEEMQLTIRELKQTLQQSSQIQLRALRCIQNEAEIKTRLYRYQKYVSQLKLSMKSFKKLQSEKFNYILAKNYRQYELLEKKYGEACAALGKEEGHSRALNQTLQRERLRLNYFEKLLVSNYHHDPIPECSEENSSTDREIPPAPVQ